MATVVCRQKDSEELPGFYYYNPVELGEPKPCHCCCFVNASTRVSNACMLPVNQARTCSSALSAENTVSVNLCKPAFHIKSIFTTVNWPPFVTSLMFHHWKWPVIKLCLSNGYEMDMKSRYQFSNAQDLV